MTHVRSLNPYESPQPAEVLSQPAQSDDDQVLPPLRGPSMGLLILSGLQFLPLVAAPFSVIAVLMNNPRGLLSPQQLEELTIAAVQLLSGVASIYIFYGARQMRQTKSLKTCRRAAIVACIPVLSPTIVLGIPFGIWALVVLFQKTVAAEFERQAAAPQPEALPVATSEPRVAAAQHGS